MVARTSKIAGISRGVVKMVSSRTMMGVHRVMGRSLIDVHSHWGSPWTDWQPTIRNHRGLATVERCQSWSRNKSKRRQSGIVKGKPERSISIKRHALSQLKSIRSCLTESTGGWICRTDTTHQCSDSWWRLQLSLPACWTMHSPAPLKAMIKAPLKYCMMFYKTKNKTPYQFHSSSKIIKEIWWLNDQTIQRLILSTSRVLATIQRSTALTTSWLLGQHLNFNRWPWASFKDGSNAGDQQIQRHRKVDLNNCSDGSDISTRFQ